MKIAVLIKQTPETADLPTVTPDEVTRGAFQAKLVINPWDEFAVEEAIQLGERLDADTLALSLGDAAADDVLKHALAMGVAAAKRIDRAGLTGGDLWTTAAALAAAVRAEGDVDLVLVGKQSVDENSGAVHVGVARKLGWTLLSNVVQVVEIADGHITVTRTADGVQETVRAPLPAVVSVGKEINEPRYPGFMGLRKASKAQIPVLDPAALGVHAAARAAWTNLRKPAARATTVRLIPGATPQEQAANLVDTLLTDKVI